MNIFDYILFDKNGIYISLGLVLLIIIIYYLNKKIKPSFVLPKGKINLFKKNIINILIFIILTLIVILPLNLAIITGQKTIQEKNLNIQILFDVSLSMTADDIKPSRFQAAKSSVINLVQNLTGYNISIIIFSGIPFVRAPFTDDNKALVSKLNDMSLSEFPPTMNFVGTAIGDAIIMGTKNITKIGNQKGLIILITDGDSNKGSEPLQSVDVSNYYDLPIYTLGIGNNDYVIGYDHYGSPVTTKINIDLLKNISEKSNGKFYRVLSNNDFKNIFDEISKHIKLNQVNKTEYEYLYLNQFFYKTILGILVAFLLIKIIIFLKFMNKE